MENKVLLLSFLCSTDIYSSSFKIFLACILGFSQLQCDCYYTHNIFSWKLFASAQEVGKTHVLWVSELTSSLPWLSHPGCLFWAGTDDAGEERQIAISPRSGILSFFSFLPFSFFCFFLQEFQLFHSGFFLFSPSAPDYHNCLNNYSVVSVCFLYLEWLHIMDSLKP